MQFALLISVLIALLLSAFLLLTHVQSVFRIKSNELLQACEASNQEILKSLQNSLSQEEVSTENSDTKKKELTSGYYGAWTKVTSQVTAHNRTVAKTALVGSRSDQKTANLYLANTNSPLVVVGNTRIEGNSYLPKQGVKAGNISGHYYQGTRLYYGNVWESQKNLPALDQKWIVYIKSLMQGILVNEERSIALKTDLKNSFYNDYNIIYNPSTITLGNEKITGHTIIQSNSKIVVHAGATLENVLLIAPQIVITDQVKGSMQLIASKKISVGKNCSLSYPSSITVLDTSKSTQNTRNSHNTNREINCIIGENTTIEGAVVFLSKKDEQRQRIKTHIKVAPGVEIIGEVYCQGSIELQGIVRGSVYTQQFIANQSGSIYLNHLYNAKILKNPIPEYAGLPFANSKNAIAKWLY